eukprot:2806206-Amphidinium_carterae.1
MQDSACVATDIKLAAVTPAAHLGRLLGLSRPTAGQALVSCRFVFSCARGLPFTPLGCVGGGPNGDS